MTQSLPSLTADLRDWLAQKMPQAQNLELIDAFEPAQGFSSRTIIFTARWHEDGANREKGLVARLQREVSCPLLADIFHQYRVMSVASGAPGVLVPKPLFAESDPAPLGAPFFVMERAQGRVPSDFPSYHAQGWVAELPPDRQAQLWWNGIAAMERLHRIDWRAFGSLAEGLEHPPDARFYLDRFIRPWFEWAAAGRAFPVIEAAIEEFIASAPPIARSGLVWNDARMGNVMFAEDDQVSALFDFEVATLGPPEIDLAWWVYADEIFSEGFGVSPLPAIPRGDAVRSRFEALYGHAMPDFDYYLALAALKHAVISIREYGNDKREAAAEDHAPFAMERMARYLAQFRGDRAP